MDLAAESIFRVRLILAIQIKPERSIKAHMLKALTHLFDRDVFAARPNLNDLILWNAKAVDRLRHACEV